MKFARVESGKVVEIVEAPRVIDGMSFELSELYHPSLVAQMAQCADDVEIGDAFELPESPQGPADNG